VVEDGKYQTLTEDPKPAMFFSFLQHPASDTWLIVRSERDPQGIAAELQRSIHNLDPALPLEIRTWNSELDSALFAARVATVSLGVLGLLGAMLAITGIFGMAAYTVSKRLRELGIRIALGADQRKVLGAALGRTFRLLAIGSIAGMILGVLATRVLSSIVYQATPKDPVILGGVILTMLCVGVVAALVPARRALAVDPMILLRDE
jgi:ABC-type antimicrobial peptide transport system permease subunit